MRFDIFTSRFDDGLIQSLLGKAALKLLTAIDPSLSTRTELLDLAVDLHTPVGTVRVSPGCFNAADDVAALVGCVREVTKIKADCKQELT